MIRLCYADVSLLRDREAQERYLGRIPEERRQRLSQIRSDAERARSLGAQLLLERCLFSAGICLAEETFAYGPFGKPRLLNHPRICFSLSHSGRYAACALSDREVGVDIQCAEKLHEKLQRRCFTPREQAYVKESADPLRAFAVVWAMKESYLKAKGTGLSVPLTAVRTDPAALKIEGSEERFGLWLTEDGVLVLCAAELPHQAERMEIE